jgi:hypothetical protein
MTHKQVIISLMLLTALPGWIKGEGTRELEPNSAYGVTLRARYDPVLNSNDGGPFATPGCPDEYKLWVSIAEVGEKILFGFQKSSGFTTVSVTIRDASDNIVFPTTAIPSSGTGYIANWNQAVAGPNTINAAGYTPFECTPPAPGDYYVEFSWTIFGQTGTQQFRFFDVTVVDAANQEKRGRLWSKNWQFQMVNNNHKFEGVMFPYTDDQITTKIQFNEMAPARFTVSCNPTGCANTGDFISDRKSRGGNFTYPAYRIFVNNPDETIYPTGIVGGVDSVNVNNPCDGTVNIDMFVNKQGMAEILLDINPLPGVQDEDVVLNDTVYTGNATTIAWNGLDGEGNLVPNGTTFNIEVTYINGLTHLPLYDVEYSAADWKGFIVDLVRPAGNKPFVFWDDRDVQGTTELNGCLDPGGCHSWNFDTGNENTINTWWFAVSTTLVPIAIQYRRSETIPYNFILCDGDSVNVFGSWVSNPGVFSDTLTNFMGCDSISEVTVTVKPGPVIELGDDQVLCQGASTTLGAVVPNVASYEWNTIPPQATPLGTNPTLTVSTTATYQVQITATNGCIRTDQVHVTAAPYINTQSIKHN